ncbi:MAG TPA: GNAT family N-acetyltransferase [Pseudomonadales bacterium]|nr:GNAT family N-acetyltransferase [Pseudomonadales bacterium]
MNSVPVVEGQVCCRLETPFDQPFLFELFKLSRLPMLADAGWSPEQLNLFLQSQFEIQKRYFQHAYPNPEFLIIQWQDQPVGRLYLAHFLHEIRLIDIALLPAFQGCGIGSRVLKNVLAEHASTNKPISLHVEKHNPALHLYLRLGFKIVADRELHWYMCTETPTV